MASNWRHLGKAMEDAKHSINQTVRMDEFGEAGTPDFRKSLRDAKRDIEYAESEIKSAMSQLKDWKQYLKYYS